MVQGTGSDVGKSLIAAALCRIARRRGVAVAPFKPQNMSNNAAACAGGEIGRAQALQAQAAGLAPEVDFNPVLLKPESDRRAQVVVQGKVVDSMSAADYMARRDARMGAVLQSFGRLVDAYELIIVEGAGSPAEINLRAGDIANMGFARRAGVPVCLVGDIDKGGVIASLVGTKAVLAAEDAALIRGFVVNKFRGDPKLFDAGVAAIESRTAWPCFGVVPWLTCAADLPAEDAVILFGTKSTLGDLAFLRAQGWDHDILSHARAGGRVLGLCGGFQLLGRSINDASGADGRAGQAQGLGLLDVHTEMAGPKTVRPVRGLCVRTGLPVAGYEIHVGETTGEDRARPLFDLEGTADGASSVDGLIEGSYLHGVFANDEFRRAWLRRAGAGGTSRLDYAAAVETALDELADGVEQAVDVEALLACASLPVAPPEVPHVAAS